MRPTYRSAAVELLRELDGTHRDLAALTIASYLERLGVTRPTMNDLLTEASAEQLTLDGDA
jgi:hypothetical protein